jgi:hypothetical protein
MALLLGVHESDRSVAERAAEFPGHGATRIFHPGVRDPEDLVACIERECGETWAAAQTAIWSFKPRPARVADGSWRPPVEDLARHLRAHRHTKPTIIVVWHEPENDIGNAFAAPEDFVHMFNTVHIWMRRIYRQAPTCHAALGYAYRDGGMDDHTARRWRTRARIKALDAYSGRSFPLATTLPDLSGYRRWRRIIVADNPRWAITERGWTCPAEHSATRAATIEREFAWLAAEQVPPQVYLIWASAGREADPGLRLDAPARRAVAAGFAHLADTLGGTL